MCVNLRSWCTYDLAPECSLTSGCDRNDIKAVLTVGSRSLVRNGRLVCPFGYFTPLDPLSTLLAYLLLNFIFSLYLIAFIIISSLLS